MVACPGSVATLGGKSTLIPYLWSLYAKNGHLLRSLQVYFLFEGAKMAVGRSIKQYALGVKFRNFLPFSALSHVFSHATQYV